MLSCDQVLAELASYLDGQVAPELLRELLAHVAQCRTCEAVYDSVRKTVRLTTESRTFELPETVSATVVTRIMARVRTRARSRG